MGGFIVLPKAPGETASSIEERYARCLDVFAKKTLKLDTRFERTHFVAYRFHKIVPRHCSSIQYENGDFIFYTGTFMYENQTGRTALARLYEDHQNDSVEENKIAGNFNLLIYSKGILSTLTDYCGYYPVYLHESSSSLSNSFLAIARIESNPTVSAHELFEYVFHGFFIGKETLLKGIRMLDSTKKWQLYPAVTATERHPVFKELPQNISFEDAVEELSAELGEYFQRLADAHGADIGAALSGGYDSRHMLALLRKSKVNPYTYVYGHETSSDVVIAKQIGAAEGLSIDHINKDSTPKIPREDLAGIVQRDAYFFDCLKPAGVIDNGTDLDTRLARAQRAYLQLNGAGGEIYREIWSIPDRRINLTAFIRQRFDHGNYQFCRNHFNREAYFGRFTEKVHAILGHNHSSIERREAEMLFPFLRNRFAQTNNAANCQISDSLLPFMEPRLVLPSFNIPIKYKYCGRLHAALIGAADRALAKHGSSYGINFQDYPPATYRVKRLFARHIPLSVRLLTRKYRSAKPQIMPYHLSKDYIETIVDFNSTEISEWMDLSCIVEPEMLSRALSIEVLLKMLR